MKKAIVLVLTFVMVLSLCACGSKEEDVVIEAESPAESAAPEAEENADGAAGTAEAAEENAAMTEAVYYHGDENAEHLVEEKAELPEKFEPQDVIDLLAGNGVLPEGIMVNTWGIDESGIMNIDFNSAFAENIQSMGTAGEAIIMGSTVNSLIKNFDLGGIVVTVDGEALATGHDIYDYTLEFYEF